MTARDLIELADAATTIHAVVSTAGSEDRRDLEAVLVLVNDSVEQHGHADWKILRTWLAVASNLIQGVIDRNEVDGGQP